MKRSCVEPWIENAGETGCLETAFKQNTNDDESESIGSTLQHFCLTCLCTEQNSVVPYLTVFDRNKFEDGTAIVQFIFQTVLKNETVLFIRTEILLQN